jgi:hypothetical protein
MAVKSKRNGDQNVIMWGTLYPLISMDLSEGVNFGELDVPTTTHNGDCPQAIRLSISRHGMVKTQINTEIPIFPCELAILPFYNGFGALLDVENSFDLTMRCGIIVHSDRTPKKVRITSSVKFPSSCNSGGDKK